VTILALVTDLETLDEAPPAGVIEIGWTSVRAEEDHADMWDFAYGELEGSMLHGIPEGQIMSPDNRAVHHIDPAELAGLPPFDPAEWRVGLDDVTHLVAHNSAFEAQWLDWGLPWVCTYKCALRAWPDAPSHSNQALKYFLGPLQDGPWAHPPHRALPDAKVTALTFGRLLELYEIEQLIQWTLEPRLLTKMSFGKHKGTKLKDIPLDYLEWVADPRKCEAADEDLRHSCRVEIEQRQKAS
jgi:exodeoxyribonuclease X